MGIIATGINATPNLKYPVIVVFIRVYIAKYSNNIVTVLKSNKS